MNLTIEYLGIEFENPFVLASGPPTANAAMISRAFNAGWAGAVIKTLCIEPVKNLQNRFSSNRINNKIFAFQNIELLSELTPENWYEEIRFLKSKYPQKVIIGSIMGDAKDKEQWIKLAIGCQEAGADILELNFSCPHGYPEKGRGAAIGQNAEYSKSITEWVKSEKKIKIPVVPKLTAAVPDISFIGESVSEAGADGICAINTYPSIMGFDLKTLRPRPSVRQFSTPGGYSGLGLKPIALRCVSQLTQSPDLPIMACGGITTGFDAAEFMLVGAPITQICTAVMLKGYSIINKMKEELKTFMGWHKFQKPSDFIGMEKKAIRLYSELDQKYKVVPAVDAVRCDGCRSCFISCRDGGYQAIEMNDTLPIILLEKCSGCSLCYQVCPNNAIDMFEVFDAF